MSFKKIILMNTLGELPSWPVVFAACDSQYFACHAEAFVYSCEKAGKDVHIHVHKPTQEVINLTCLLNATTNIRLTVSHSDFKIPTEPEAYRTYMACLRFLILPTILNYAGDVLTLDIDSIVVNDFEWPDRKKIGYFPRDPLPGTTGFENIATRVAAGALFVSKECEHGVDFSNALATAITKNEPQWFLDQWAILMCVQDLKVPGIGVTDDMFTHFDNSFLDWDFKPDTKIWSGKGDRKYDDEKYLEKEEEFKLLKDRISKYSEVFLAPRLDMPFKNSRPMVSRGDEVSHLRKCWGLFKDKVLEEYAAENTLVINEPLWRFDASLTAYFREVVKFYVPHKRDWQFETNRPTSFYMQTVFPELFTLDPKGWGGESSYRDTLIKREDFPSDPEWRKTSYNDIFFNFIKEKYIDQRKTKFRQEENDSNHGVATLTNLFGHRPYILVPLQLPHDETIQFDSTTSVEMFVERLCLWASEPGKDDRPRILLKGHPVNKFPTRQIGREMAEKYDNVEYIEKIHIHDAIKHARAVYVINSGVGQEAMLFNIPIVSFGDSDYNRITHNAAPIQDDFTAVWKAIQEEDPEERLEIYKYWYWWWSQNLYDVRARNAHVLTEHICTSG